MLSEERLRQAAHHAAQALEDSLPPPSQCHYDVSPEFRRNMKNFADKPSAALTEKSGKRWPAPPWSLSSAARPTLA